MNRDEPTSPTAAQSRARGTAARSDEAEARAEAILADLQRAADETDGEALEAVVEAVARAFAGVLRSHGQGRISEDMRQRILVPFWSVEAAMRELLPPWYWEERGQHGFHSAFGLLKAWAETPGSAMHREMGTPGAELILRIVTNELDSLCAAYALGRRGPAFPPMSVLMPAQRVTTH